MSYFTKTIREKSICGFYLSQVFPILIILFIGIADIKSQVPVKIWDRTVGGSDQDILWSLIHTADHGFILGGASLSDSSADKSEPHKGGGDFWIIKLDSLGNKIWDKTIGTFSYDAFRAIVQTEDGGYICGGPSDIGISGDKSENVKGESDYWVIKLDETGNKLWDKTIGGAGSDELWSIVETPDGGCLLGGTSFSNASGDKSENAKGENDYWIVKLDSIGNIQWDKTYGGSSSEELLTMVRILNGGYLIGGYSRSDSSGDKSENTRGDSDYWVLKLDAEGNKLWDKTFGGNSEELLQTVFITSDGNYLLGGSSYSDSSGDKSEMSKGGSDYWVVKLDSSGNKLWDRTIGSSDREGCQSVIEISNGSYVLGGSSSADIEGDKSQMSKGGSDFWIINLSKSGDKIWDKTYGANSNEGLKTVLQSSDLALVIGGTSDSDAGGDKSDNSKGDGDYWLMKLNLISPGMDSTAPVISILADTIFSNNDPGFCSASVYWIDPEVTDEDGVALIQSDYSPSDIFPVGSTLVTYTATDSLGNTSTASFVIIVSDTEAPVVVVRDITISLTDSGYVIISPLDIDNGSTDNCGIASYHLDKFLFDTSSLGLDTVVLTVIDGQGNATSTNAEVNVQPGGVVPAAPTASVTKQPTCNTPTGTITVSAPTTGHTYSFDDGMSFQTSRTKNGLAPGTYLIKVKVNTTGYISASTQVIIQDLPSNPSAPVVTVTKQPNCAMPLGTAVVTAPTSGHKYSFDNGIIFQASRTMDSLYTGIYLVRIMSNATGCISEPTLVLIDTVPASGPPPPIASVTKQPTCTTPTGTITVSNPTSGHTYSFDNGMSFQTSRVKAGLQPGLVHLKIKSNATGCISDSISLFIDTIPENPDAPQVIVSAQPTCAIPTGTLKVTDTLPGFKYSFDQGMTFQSSKTKSGLAPGYHQVLAQSIATGCISGPTLVSIDSVPASGPPPPIASVTKQPTCTTPTGTITVSNPTSGHTYSFDNGMSFQTSRVKAGLQPGLVHLKIKSNATDCISDSISLFIDTIPENPDAPQVIVSAQPTCAIPTGTLKVTDTLPGFKYSFDQGMTFQSSKTKSGLAPGSHQVLAQSIATGCISEPTLVSIDSVPASGPPPPTASVTKQPTCTSPTGTIAVSNPTAGHTYSFDNGMNFQTSRVRSGLDSGDYYIRLKSNLTGCISEATYVYIGGLPDNPPAPQVIVSKQPTCALPTGTLKVTDSVAGHRYSFDQGMTFQTSKTKSGLAPGYHLVLAQFIATGCVSEPTLVFIDSVPTSGPPPPIGGVTVQPTCPSPTGTITIFFPTNGHTYSFDDGLSFQTSRIKSELTSGTYLLRIKSNATGCNSDPISVNVNEPPFLRAPDASVSVQASCESPSGAIVVDNPTTGHTYSFDNGESFQDSATLSGLPPSIYFVRVRSNTTGCISEERMVVIDSVFCDSLISGLTIPSRINSLSPALKSVGLSRFSAGTYRLFPNPAAGYFRISMDQDLPQGNLTLRMTDSHGRVLRQFERTSKGLVNESINAKDLPRGIIYIQLISPEIRYPVVRLVLVD